MSVTVDHELFEANQLGLETVGQVLTHFQRLNRLVVNLLIDGEEPEPGHLGEVRRKPINDHIVYIETADPYGMAMEVLDEVQVQLSEAERLRKEAINLLQRNHVERALQKLSGCFSTWMNAQESVTKTAQLLRVDLDECQADGRPLNVVIHEFNDQLRLMKRALENRDYVLLADTLLYESTDTNHRWQEALDAVRHAIVH